MGKDKSGAAETTGPVVLHLDRAVAHDLLQALTQALEPHSSNIVDDKKKIKLTGKSIKAK
ncbi:MAG TPA: hypothetical protein VHA33_26145 [Candidatus Angelobacter sp.]|jgi:hypothetical protein|nr:hypothetical protein [Candidatus Angelobacter sp.]